MNCEFQKRKYLSIPYPLNWNLISRLLFRYHVYKWIFNSPLSLPQYPRQLWKWNITLEWCMSNSTHVWNPRAFAEDMPWRREKVGRLERLVTRCITNTELEDTWTEYKNSRLAPFHTDGIIRRNWSRLRFSKQNCVKIVSNYFLYPICWRSRVNRH